MARTLMARSPFNFFMSMGALCCPWAMATRVLIQSAQKPYASFPLPYVLYIKFDQTRDIYFFEYVNRQRQQTINILINIPHFSL